MKFHLDFLEKLENILTSDFDDFWNYNMFKSEFESTNSKLIVAKQDDLLVLGFAGIWFVLEVAHITNIVVKKDMRKTKISVILQRREVLK